MVHICLTRLFLCVPPHSVPAWLVQRRPGEHLHLLPEQQHQRHQRVDLPVQPRLRRQRHWRLAYLL